MITTLTTATGISVVKFIFQQLEIGANRTKSWKKQEIDRSHKNTIFPSSRFFFKKREESRKRQQKCCLLFNILRKRKKEAAIPPFFPDQTKTTKKKAWAEKKLSSFFCDRWCSKVIFFTLGHQHRRVCQSLRNLQSCTKMAASSLFQLILRFRPHPPLMYLLLVLPRCKYA